MSSYSHVSQVSYLLCASCIISYIIGDRGFSIGVDDVTPSVGMTKIKNKLVIEGQRLAQEEIQAYTTGTYALSHLIFCFV
jgi:hypothetical protein